MDVSTERTATNIGKPGLEFINRTLFDLGRPAHEVMMIGDDMDIDIRGGTACGLSACLVRTGRFRQDDFAPGNAKPDYVFDSRTQWPELVIYLISNQDCEYQIMSEH